MEKNNSAKVGAALFCILIVLNSIFVFFRTCVILMCHGFE